MRGESVWLLPTELLAHSSAAEPRRGLGSVLVCPRFARLLQKDPASAEPADQSGPGLSQQVADPAVPPIAELAVDPLSFSTLKKGTSVLEHALWFFPV